MKKFKELTEPREMDFYSISEENGEKFIQVLGYVYFGDVWEDVYISGFEMPLSEFVEREKEEPNFIGEEMAEYKQYPTDYTFDEEILDVINTYFDGKCADYELSYSEITMETPCGNYVC